MSGGDRGIVRGVVWWVTRPAMGRQQHDNPAPHVCVSAAAATQIGTGSLHGEPERPVFGAGEIVTSTRTDSQGRFELVLPLGLYQVYPGGIDRVMSLTEAMVEVEAGTEHEIELVVTGGV